MLAFIRSARGATLPLLLLLHVSGCAALYKVQLSDIEANRGKGQAKPVSVKVSQTTVNLKEIADIAGAVGRANRSKGLNGASRALDTYTSLFQFGPRTGTPVYNEYYAREIPELLAAECKNGRLINLTSVREARDYPIVKGEIVRVDALCVQP